MRLFNLRVLNRLLDYLQRGVCLVVGTAVVAEGKLVVPIWSVVSTNVAAIAAAVTSEKLLVEVLKIKL